MRMVKEGNNTDTVMLDNQHNNVNNNIFMHSINNNILDNIDPHGSKRYCTTHSRSTTHTESSNMAPQKTFSEQMCATLNHRRAINFFSIVPRIVSLHH